MCTALFAYKAHPNYPLIILSNRDEFYNRPTAQANYWDESPNVLSGIDLEKGGTWFGVTKTGRFSLLTNYRDFSKHIESPLSRGLLTKQFLMSKHSPINYLKELETTGNQYNPYNIVVGDLDEFSYYCNVSDSSKILSPGIHGLSNGLINANWPKIDAGIKGLEQILTHTVLDEAMCFDLLSNSKKYTLDLLPNTGVDKQLEIDLSSLFVKIDGYGTRMQTLFYVEKDLSAHFIERSRDTEGIWHEQRFDFMINH